MEQEITINLSLRRFGIVLVTFDDHFQADNPDLLVCDVKADHRHVFEIPQDVGLIHGLLYALQDSPPFRAEEPCCYLEALKIEEGRTRLRVFMDDDLEPLTLWWKEFGAELEAFLEKKQGAGRPGHKGGRSPYPEDQWAREQMEAGRSIKEIYPEWEERLSKKRKQNQSPSIDILKSAMRRGRRKGY